MLTATQPVPADPVLHEASTGLASMPYAGLLLTGGCDVNPARYGEAPGPETQEPDDERDASEAALIDEALGRDIPVLASCKTGSPPAASMASI